MVDATVLFAGTVWPRWSYEVLRHASQEDFHLVLPPLVIEQARRNLHRKFPQLVDRFDNWLASCPLEPVPDPSPQDEAVHRALVRHGEDVPVALAAIRAGVDYFVSEDKDFTAEDATTQAVQEQLKILRPVIFLREVMGWSSDELERVRRRDWPIEGG
jgi:hypothetical protein